LNFSCETCVESEKERLLKKYDCKTLNDVLEKQEDLLKKLHLKERVLQKSPDDI